MMTQLTDIYMHALLDLMSQLTTIWKEYMLFNLNVIFIPYYIADGGPREDGYHISYLPKQAWQKFRVTV